MSDGTEERIERARREAAALNIAMEIIPHVTSGKVTADAAAALGTSEDRILKMMILVDHKTGMNVGVLVRGDERINQKKLRAVSGLKQLRFASPEEATAITGYVVGGIPPIGLDKCSMKIVSNRVQEVDYVFGSGGSEFCAMKIAPAEIGRIPGLVYADIGAEDEG